MINTKIIFYNLTTQLTFCPRKRVPSDSTGRAGGLGNAFVDVLPADADRPAAGDFFGVFLTLFGVLTFLVLICNILILSKDITDKSELNLCVQVGRPPKKI